MRVALDITIASHALGGVGRYVLGLAGALRDAAGERGIDTLIVDVPAAHRGVVAPAGASVILADPFYLGMRGLRRLAAGLSLEARTRGSRLSALLGADVFHHSGVQPAKPAGSRSVLTFFDPSALEHPEWHTAATVGFAAEEARLVRRGSALLAISEWSASKAREIFGKGCLVGVAGGAAADFFTPGEPEEGILSALGLEAGGYLLHVGNFVPRKNIPMLMEARAQAGGSGLVLPLVLAGAGGWKEPDTAADGVLALRNVTDRQLLSLYRGARALLLPSAYEGLGLPALEAMACGCGVVAADATALPETLDGCGLLLPPGSASIWAGTMLSLQDGSLAGELRERALERRRPTWSSVAGRACDFYTEAVDR